MTDNNDRPFRARAGNNDADHSFVAMPKERFEHFAMALHEAQPDVLSAHLYAPDGQTQFGVDHLAYHHEGGVEAGQAKRVKKVRQADIRKWACEFLDHWNDHWHDKGVTLFRLFVAVPVKNRMAHDEIVAQRRAFQKLGLGFELWDANAIHRRLAGAKQVVRYYLGQDAYDQLFGRPVGPFSELAAQMDAGSRGAFTASAIARELHVGSTAELAELRRRVRRGERSAVADRIRDKLRDPKVALAFIPADHAAHLRLLASIAIEDRDFDDAKRHLDEADQVDESAHGSSQRLRAVLCLERDGPEAALQRPNVDATPEVGEVRAVALLRLGRPDEALAELRAPPDGDEREAEYMRLSAIGHLMAGRRTAANELADKAVAREPENRACLFASAVCRFHLALSEAVPPAADDWPRPIELPLVKSTREAEKHLEAAGRAFAQLAAQKVDGRQADMHAWRLAAACLSPSGREEAQAYFDTLSDGNQLTAGVVAWAMASGLQIDIAATTDRLDAVFAANREDVAAALVLMALLHNRKRRKAAYNILETVRPALLRQCEDQIVAYWEAILSPDIDSVAQHRDASLPYAIRFRAAHAIRARGRRLAALEVLLGEMLEGSPEPAIVLAATQILHENGRDEAAALSARFLIEDIATGEAIGLAASTLASAGRFSEALEALERADAFPDGRLPVGLTRLKADCLARSGAIVEANRQSAILADATGHPDDVRRAIRASLAVGAIDSALDLFLKNETALERPTPEHVLLARALAGSEPLAASRITLAIADRVPDELVPAVFDLAHRLKLADQRDKLLRRLVQSADQPNAMVQRFQVDDIGRFFADRKKRFDELGETYASGRMPIQGFAAIDTAPLLRTHLRPFFETTVLAARHPVFARYGRRFEEIADWGEPHDLTIAIDLTALLAAGATGIIDAVEDAFRGIVVSSLTSPALLEMRAALEPVDQSRIKAAMEVLVSVDRGEVELSTTPDPATRLSWSEKDEPRGIPVAPLAAAATARWNKSRRRAVFEELGLAEDPAGIETLAAGTKVTANLATATSLAAAGIWHEAAAMFELSIEASDRSGLDAVLAQQQAENRSAETIDALIARVRRGLATGKWRTASTSDHEAMSYEHHCLMDILDAARGEATIGWIDDRTVTSIRHAELRVCSSVEVIDLLEAAGVIDPERRRNLRRRLRAAGWLFIPIDETDIQEPLVEAASEDSLDECEALAEARAATAFHLQHRKRLQWPRPEQIETGIQGEVPFLLDLGHATGNTLAGLWCAEDLDTEQAAMASSWVLDNLDTSLFPMAVLGAGDPRSDFTLGTTLGSLALHVLQVNRRGDTAGRQAGYSRWLWGTLMRELLRARPEALPHTIEMMAVHIVNSISERDEVGFDENVWRGFVARAFNTLPTFLRWELLQRDDVREAFGFDQPGELAVGRASFAERPFWQAVVACGSTGPASIVDAEGKRWTIEHRSAGGETGLHLTAEGQSLVIPDWPLEVATARASSRKPAVALLAQEHDLSTEETRSLLKRAAKATPEAAIEAVIAASSASMRTWYDHFAATLADRGGLDLDDCLPDRWARVGARLRLDRANDIFKAAADSLIEEQGLVQAARRFASLPCLLPRVIADRLRSMEPASLEAFLAEWDEDQPMPWARLRIAEVLLRREDAETHIPRIRSDVEHALSEELEPLWALRLGLARMLVSDGPLVADWSAASPRARLACGWHHADELARILVRRGAPASHFLEIVLGRRGNSPRNLLGEDPVGIPADRSDPRYIQIERMLAIETGPILAGVARFETHREWVDVQLLRARFGHRDGKDIANLNIAGGAFAPNDALESLYCDKPAASLEELREGAGIASANGAEQALAGFLAERDLSDHDDTALLVRVMAGVAAMHPLPRSIAGNARALLKDYRPSWEGEATDPQEAASTLLAFACLVSVNGWRAQAGRVDALFADFLTQLAKDDAAAGTLMADVAYWRARMEKTAEGRLSKIAGMLGRLGERSELEGASRKLALDFARKLSGTQSAPFIDLL